MSALSQYWSRFALEADLAENISDTLHNGIYGYGALEMQ
jgi:hypothetical protein